MILKSERSVRRLLAAHNLTIHSLRHNKHWVARVSRNGGPVKRVIVSYATHPHAMKKIEADLRRIPGIDLDFKNPKSPALEKAR